MPRGGGGKGLLLQRCLRVTVANNGSVCGSYGEAGGRLGGGSSPVLICLECLKTV